MILILGGVMGSNLKFFSARFAHRLPPPPYPYHKKLIFIQDRGQKFSYNILDVNHYYTQNLNALIFKPHTLIRTIYLELILKSYGDSQLLACIAK